MTVIEDKELHAVVRTRTSIKTIVIRIVIAIVVLGAASAGYAFWKNTQRFETTDDAEVDGQIYAVSSRVSGHVKEVLIEDQQIVKAGDVLVRMDPTDFEVALAKAKADLADAVAALQTSRTDVPIMTANTTSTLQGARSSKLDAQAAVSGAEQQLGAARARLSTAQANVRVGEANHQKAAQDVARYKILVDKDEISKQVYDSAVSALNAGQATLEAQRAQVVEAQQNIAVGGEDHRADAGEGGAGRCGDHIGDDRAAQVRVTESRAQSAQAKVQEEQALVHQAELNLEYTTIVAPVNGIVGKKNVEAGAEHFGGPRIAGGGAA